MLNTDAQITDLDLDAYVDGQLTDAQRSEVEAHLSRAYPLLRLAPR